MPRRKQYANEEERHEAEVERRRRSGIRNPFPRGTCPRCGQDVALARDRLSTLVHDCWTSADDAWAEELGHRDLPLAIAMDTGAIVRDPTGYAGAASERRRLRAALKARLIQGDELASVSSLITEWTAVSPPTEIAAIRADDVPLLIGGLALLAVEFPQFAEACLEQVGRMNEAESLKVATVAYHAMCRCHLARSVR